MTLYILVLTPFTTKVDVVMFSVMLEKLDERLGAFGSCARQVQVTGRGGQLEETSQEVGCIE